jgi:hypothetical protein
VRLVVHRDVEGVAADDLVEMRRGCHAGVDETAPVSLANLRGPDAANHSSSELDEIDTHGSRRSTTS